MRLLNCSDAPDPKLKILSVSRPQGLQRTSNERGAQMISEIVAVVGLVFAAASLGRIAYERQMDVLYGPYIEGRTAQPTMRMILKPLRPIADRLRFKLR